MLGAVCLRMTPLDPSVSSIKLIFTSTFTKEQPMGLLSIYRCRPHIRNLIPPGHHRPSLPGISISPTLLSRDYHRRFVGNGSICLSHSLGKASDAQGLIRCLLSFGSPRTHLYQRL